MLRALDWDTENPVEVRHEFKAGGGHADYALVRGNSVAAIIEAKKLGTNLGTVKPGRVIKYTQDQQCKDMKAFVLTNGDEWIVLRESSDWDQTTAKVSSSGEFETAFDLHSWLSKANFPVGGEVPPPPRPPRPPPLGIPLDQIKVEKDGSRKGRVNFPDRTTTTFKSWADLYFKIAKHLVDVGVLHSGLEPIGFTTGHRYAVAAQAVHGDGKAFTAPRDIDGGLFLETNNSGALTLKYALQLIERCGLKPSDFTVQLDS